MERRSSMLTLGTLAATLGLSLAVLEKPAAAAPACTASDCIIYDIDTQDVCTEVTAEAPTGDNRWGTAGLSLHIDQALKGGHIAAYKIQWFSGGWSGWYIPGVNDIDGKFWAPTNSLTRVWRYFADHPHTYVICKNVP